jgi:hypothetical protein
MKTKRKLMNICDAFTNALKMGANGRGYKIVAEYEAENCQVIPNYIRATTVE